MVSPEDALDIARRFAKELPLDTLASVGVGAHQGELALIVSLSEPFPNSYAPLDEYGGMKVFYKMERFDIKPQRS